MVWLNSVGRIWFCSYKNRKFTEKLEFPAAFFESGRLRVSGGPESFVLVADGPNGPGTIGFFRSDSGCAQFLCGPVLDKKVQIVSFLDAKNLFLWK